MSVQQRLVLVVLTSACALALLYGGAARADSVPTGARASAARAEAEGFVALEEKRDCDAARSFLLAHALAPDGRLVINAALALQRYGARAQALELFQSVRGTPAAVVADVDARIATIEHDRSGGGAVCTGIALDERNEAAAEEGSPLLPAGIAALASGLVVAGSTVGTVAWLHFGIIQNAAADGGDREGAMAAQSPVLFAGSSIAGALVVAGAVLVPLSFVQELP